MLLPVSSRNAVAHPRLDIVLDRQVLAAHHTGQRRHRHLLPLISLKAVECAVCVLVLLLIFSLGVSGPIGYSALRWLIRWKYRRIEDKDALTFSLATFLVVALLLVVNCYVLFTICRLRDYLRLKALHLYSQHRNQIIRNIIRTQ
uniref:G_PROTEIN_RECEP_F1_2 domain-containing protein n=1 Tax=Globodera pallida TaxID=36090 RepID=A0A183BWS0_GLOPA